MNLRPLHDRVIVKRQEKETTTAGASSSPAALPKSRLKASLSPLVRARASTAKSARWMSKLATACCSASFRLGSES